MAEINVEALTELVERLEQIDAEIKPLKDEKKEVFADAKEKGFVPAIIREIVKERKLDEDTRNDQYELYNTYRGALGMINKGLDGTPLGNFAAKDHPDAPVDLSKRRGRRAARPVLFDEEHPTGATQVEVEPIEAQNDDSRGALGR